MDGHTDEILGFRVRQQSIGLVQCPRLRIDIQGTIAGQQQFVIFAMILYGIDDHQRVNAERENIGSVMVHQRQIDVLDANFTQGT